jgi:disulfide bond formation protein DsbB
MSNEKFADTMKQGGVALFFLGLFVYAFLLGLYALGVDKVVAMLQEKPVYTFGLPICGVGAFAIVSVLERLAPAHDDPSGKLEFKAFGLTFSGPAGPVTLWVVCYLVLVASIRIVQ